MNENILIAYSEFLRYRSRYKIRNGLDVIVSYEKCLSMPPNIETVLIHDTDWLNFCRKYVIDRGDK